METVYHEPSKSLVVLTDEKIKEIKVKGTQSEYFKILALSEQFSPKHPQDIVDGKLKEGKVLVECEIVVENSHYNANYKQPWIKLNSSNHITLHKVEEKMYSLEVVKAAFEAGREDYGRKWFFHKWFEQNVK